MKVFLMYKDKDFDLHVRLPSNSETLIQDLRLNILFDMMAKNDDFLREVSKVVLLSSLTKVDDIFYRQEALKDCLKNIDLVRKMYAISLESFEVERKTFFGFFSKYPIGMLDSSIRAMKILIELLKKLRKMALDNSNGFHSSAFKNFFDRIKDELTDEYFAEVESHLKKLEFRNGLLISAQLGEGNKGKNYVLRGQNDEKKRWLSKIFSKKDEAYTFKIDERDQNGAKALSNLKERGINSVANALSQSVEHMMNFFKNLRTELAFYLAAVNLYEELKNAGKPLSFPIPFPHNERTLHFEQLYDPSLALKGDVVSNSLNVSEKNLFIITGANRGGKTTFSRSIGIAFLMMQAGLFVTASAFSSNIFKKFFTHYRREEDREMESGKLDEELKRMNSIVNNITSDSLVLFNESFSSTSELEGSEIAKEIVLALKKKNVEMFFVTHMYTFARDMYEERSPDTFFLVAERLKNGDRTFKIKEGIPSQTSYGVDIYKKIFNESSSHYSNVNN